MPLKYLCVFCTSIFVFFSSTFNSEIKAACEVCVFDCAQGNVVAVRYKKKSMIFDAGRTAYKRFILNEDDKDYESLRDEQYPLAEGVSNLQVAEEVGNPQVAEEVGNLQIIRNIPTERDGWDIAYGDNEYYKEEFEKTFKRFVFGKIEKKRGRKYSNILKAIFISHPDEDHYSLVPELGLQPEVFVLGGKFSLYNTKFRTHVTGKNIVKDSDEEYVMPGSRDRYKGNAFFTEHCTFGTAEEDPQVDILSVNAGKAGTTKNKNKDSMIVKLTMPGKYSMLIPGDAEQETWEDAENNVTTAGLKADVLLLSHHGSMTNGSTSLELLRKIQPKFCLISAGFQHNHPTEEIIDMLLDYYNNNSNRVSPHFVTYHKGKKRHCLMTDAPIFTTIDNGALTIDLSATALKVICARDFSPSPSIFLTGEDSDENEYMTYLDRADDKQVLSQLPEGAEKNTTFGEDVFKKDDNYYYQLGEAFLKMKLITEEA